MSKTKKVNQGFSLIELLIAVTILSVVMVMVVQFMGSSSAAYRKTKKNLNIQTEAMKVVEQMSDTLMQANYVRIMTKDDGMYEIVQDDASVKNERTIKEADSYTPISYDLVPDSYGVYSEFRRLDSESKRDVIVNFDTFHIVSKTGTPYPISGDFDYTGSASNEVRSFRILKADDKYNYIKPEYIYAEYYRDSGQVTADTGDIIYKTVHVLYYISDITDTRDDTCSIYMMQYETPYSNSQGFGWARMQMANKIGISASVDLEAANADAFTEVEQTIGDDVEGLVTDNLVDFYLSADVEGNSFLTNILFADDGYEYNAIETINFRNSNVLTVRPQKLLKVKGTGNADGSVGGSTGGGTTNSGESGAEEADDTSDETAS